MKKLSRNEMKNVIGGKHIQFTCNVSGICHVGGQTGSCISYTQTSCLCYTDDIVGYSPECDAS
jgi:bacteriocin-like protein